MSRLTMDNGYLVARRNLQLVGNLTFLCREMLPYEINSKKETPIQLYFIGKQTLNSQFLMLTNKQKRFYELQATSKFYNFYACKKHHYTFSYTIDILFIYVFYTSCEGK